MRLEAGEKVTGDWGFNEYADMFSAIECEMMGLKTKMVKDISTHPECITLINSVVYGQSIIDAYSLFAHPARLSLNPSPVIYFCPTW